MIARILTALSLIALGSLGWVAASAVADGTPPPPPPCTASSCPGQTQPTPPPTSTYTPPPTSSYTPPASTSTYTNPSTNTTPVTHHKAHKVVHHKAKPPKPMVIVHPHLAAVHPWQPAPAAKPLPATKAPAKVASTPVDAPASSYYWIYLAGGGILIAIAAGVVLASSGLRARRPPEGRSGHAYNR